MPVAMGGGEVDVSFHPVSSAGGVSFDDSKMPRFVASGDPDMVVEIDDCVTTLLFPFVTNKAGFDTGMITNTSSDGHPAPSLTTAPTHRHWETGDKTSDGLASRQDCTWVPGLHHGLWISGCVRLCLRSQRLRRRRGWRRAISLYARIARGRAIVQRLLA